MQIQKLKAKITENNLTQQKLAELMGLSLQTINLKVNGKIPINVYEAEKLTCVLKIDNPIEIFFN